MQRRTFDVPPRILIVAPGLDVGGVERSLLGLLGSLASTCSVDLFLHSHDGALLGEIPRGVRLIPEVEAYSLLDKPISIALRSSCPWIGATRLAAKTSTFLASARGRPSYLANRAVRYSLPFLPRIGGRYDLAASFLAPHDVVLSKVDANVRVGWIHTDYGSLESGVDVRLEARSWEGLDHLVAVSPDVARAFAAVFGVERDRIRVVENVLDPDWIRRCAGSLDASLEMPVGPGEFRICSAGRLAWAKGFDIAAEACKRLVDRGVPLRWYVLGFGSEEAMVRSIVERHGLASRFVLLGKRSNPYPYIAACDLYVQPSRYEGKSVAVREAQILGRPVLVSRFPTAGSQLEDGMDGVIADAGADGLAEGIERLLGDADLRRRISGNSMGRDYSNRDAVEGLLDLLPVPGY